LGGYSSRKLRRGPISRGDGRNALLKVYGEKTDRNWRGGWHREKLHSKSGKQPKLPRENERETNLEGKGDKAGGHLKKKISDTRKFRKGVKSTKCCIDTGCSDVGKGKPTPQVKRGEGARIL